ncbi:MAG TPA: hypothetical protein VFI25_17540 [Planctomycetota bacterium]|jgi:hypothetical protein|nr:hypothetical protein [Planctomycetota bacterium]
MRALPSLLLLGAFPGDPAWRDPQAPRTLGLQALGSEGSPPSANAGRTVFLVSLPEGGSWSAAVDLLARERAPRAVVRFSWDRLGAAFAALEELGPESVVVFTDPKDLDANRHFDFLERASRLDADPFVDFDLGYLTAASPEEGGAFVENLLRAGARGGPRRVLEFGPGEANAFSGFARDPFAKGFDRARLTHRSARWLLEKEASRFAGCAVLQAFGHGSPEGISGGPRARDLRDSRLDLFPATVFAGPCYCGVTHRWFDPSGGRVRIRTVDPLDSFSLALIARGATAVFAGLDPDRGETSRRELEALLACGGPLGAAIRATYADVVLGYRREPFSLLRYEEGRPAPQENLLDTMLTGGACRVLLGDPTLRPFDKATEPPWKTRIETGKGFLAVIAEADDKVGSFWSSVNVYHAEGSWTHQVRVTVELDDDLAQGLGDLREVAFERDGRPGPVAFPTAGIERRLGRTLLHLLAVLPGDGPNRALADGRRFRARFVLERDDPQRR